MATFKYPINLKLEDKKPFICKPLGEKDRVQLEKFFRKIPRLDMEVFKDDVIKNENIENWFANPLNKKLVQLAVFRENKIVANATLHSEGIYWQKTAEIKVVVDPNYRRRGIGTQMFNILLAEGLKCGMQKLIIRYASDNKGVTKILENYGFKPEITLNYYLYDKKKNIHKDLIVASLNIVDWKRRFEFYNTYYNFAS